MFDQYGNWVGNGVTGGIKSPDFSSLTNYGVAANASPTTAITGNTGSIWDSFLQQNNAKTGMASGGWGSAALGLASGLTNAWIGFNQYGLAKDQLAFQKDSFKKNYDAQRQTTNTALEDRQKARVAANPGAYQSVGTYMNENRIA